MSSVQPAVTFEWSAPAQRFVFGLEKWAALVQDWRPVFREARGAFFASEAQHFATEGRSTGGAFAALSPAYARRKRRLYPGRPILTASGRLRDVLTGARSDGAISRITRDEFVQGVRGNVSGARYHDSGTRYMPRRRPLRLVSDPRRQGFGRNLLQIMQRTVVEHRKRALGVG